MEGAQELFFSAGIILNELFRVKTGVGDITPTSSGDFDFGKDSGRFL
jgi:hypothetical protein